MKLNKGAFIPDAGPEKAPEFINALKNLRNTQLPTWFLKNKKVRMGPDAEGNVQF